MQREEIQSGRKGDRKFEGEGRGGSGGTVEIYELEQVWDLQKKQGEQFQE